MGSEMTKRNIQTELHRFERLKTHTYKVNRLTDILHSRMCSCKHKHTHTHTYTHTFGLVVQWFLYGLEGRGFQFICAERERANRIISQVTLFLERMRSCGSIHL